jgi:hypothetical protein
MRSVRRLGVSAAILIGAFLVAAVLAPPEKSAGPCAAVNRAALGDVPEASGLAVSRRHPGLIWTHNDSGNEPVLFALDGAGILQGRVRVPIRTRDWEDISAASCSRGQCLYVGDIGDNDLLRRSIQVYRVAEPEPGTTQTERPAVITLTYPDGPHNAEAMFVAGGRLFIVTRDRVGTLYRSTAAPDDVLSDVSRANPNITLQRIGRLGLLAVTDAETSPDGASVAVRTPDEVVIYRTADLVGAPDKAQPANRIPINVFREPQGEGVALGDNGMLYLASEGRPWNRAGRFISLRCSMRLP